MTATTDPRRKLAAAAWVLVPAALLVVMLVQAHLRGDYDPAGERRMADHPGDLTHFLLWGAAELAVLTLIIRPWSFRWSVGRIMLAFVLWVPWALFNLAACMHCGMIGGSHGLWAMLIALALFAGLIVTVLGAARRRAAAS